MKKFANISKILTTTLQYIIRGYQYTISPDHGMWRKSYGHCRYYPTCSEYTYQALGRFGMVRGLLLSAKRIMRCHPFRPPSIDPVPPNTEKI